MTEYQPKNREEARIIAAWEANEQCGHIPTVAENAQVFLGLKRYAHIDPAPMAPLKREEVLSGQS